MLLAIAVGFCAGCSGGAIDASAGLSTCDENDTELEATAATVVDLGRQERFTEANVLVSDALSKEAPTAYEAGRLLEALGHAEVMGAEAADRRLDPVTASLARQRAMTALAATLAMQESVIADALGAEGVDR